MKYSPIRGKVNAEEVGAKLREHPEKLIAQAEAVYHQKLCDVCDTAINGHHYIILVTGPSASGKTTSAKRIASILESRGKKVNRISLDNFYQNKENLPRWEDGYQNYESVEGLDIQCFDSVMSELLTKGSAVFPIFDFSMGRRSPKTFTLEFDEKSFLIIEGIHALNPVLFNVLKDYPAMKVYISVHSEIVNGSGDVIFSARDLRLCRRILRDFHCRSTSAEGTLKMWKYVLKGEKLYIFPFREHADLHIDSIHAYEPFLYHNGLKKMMDAIPPDNDYFEKASRLLTANHNFFPIPGSMIPESSLIQEFIHENVLAESKIKIREV